MIKKTIEDNINFIEWISAISVYSIYTKEQILRFVFRMIDQDHDNFISKKDLISLLVTEIDATQIYPSNYIKAIEILEIERSDKISFE